MEPGKPLEDLAKEVERLVKRRRIQIAEGLLERVKKGESSKLEGVDDKFMRLDVDPIETAKKIQELRDTCDITIEGTYVLRTDKGILPFVFEELSGVSLASDSTVLIVDPALRKEAIMRTPVEKLEGMLASYEERERAHLDATAHFAGVLRGLREKLELAQGFLAKKMARDFPVQVDPSGTTYARKAVVKNLGAIERTAAGCIDAWKKRTLLTIETKGYCDKFNACSLIDGTVVMLAKELKRCIETILVQLRCPKYTVDIELGPGCYDNWKFIRSAITVCLPGLAKDVFGLEINVDKKGEKATVVSILSEDLMNRAICCTSTDTLERRCRKVKEEVEDVERNISKQTEAMGRISDEAKKLRNLIGERRALDA